MRTTEERFAVRTPDDLMALIRFAHGDLEAGKLRAVLSVWNVTERKGDKCPLGDRMRVRFLKSVPRSAVVEMRSRDGEWNRVAQLHYNKAINWCRVELGARKADG